LIERTHRERKSNVLRISVPYLVLVRPLDERAVKVTTAPPSVRAPIATFTTFVSPKKSAMSCCEMVSFQARM
jgi:hypothetical protein